MSKNCVNDAPIITSDDLTTTQGAILRLNPIITDPDGDTVTKAFSGWMTKSSTIVDFNQVGTHQVTITVTDSKGVQTQKTISITVPDSDIGKPDLAITLIDPVPLRTTVGTPTTITVKVKNKGEVAVTNGELLVQTFKGILSQELFTFNLAPGEEITISPTITYTETGIHTINVRLDPSNKIDEKYEHNPLAENNNFYATPAIVK